MKLLTLDDVSKQQVESWIKISIQDYKEVDGTLLSAPRASDLFVFLGFFEPSTRTRLSFEMASKKLKLNVLNLGDAKNSSIVKGETLKESLRTLNSMGADLAVLRANMSVDEMRDAADVFDGHVINGGSGVEAHPTQALLDIATLINEGFQIHKSKILFIGDIQHSRVWASHKRLSALLGYELGVLTPAKGIEATRSGDSHDKAIQNFSYKSEALEWADSCILLRPQRERHSGAFISDDEYKQKFRFNSSDLLDSKNFYVLHPGPYQVGLEFESAVLENKNCLISNQVKMGVSMRKTLIQELLYNKESQ